MLQEKDRGFKDAISPGLFAGIALALLAFVGVRLQLTLATAAFLFLIVIVLLSRQGSFLSLAVVSLLAVGFLVYYFAPPIFTFKVSDPFDIVAIVLFLTTSSVITQLVSRVRLRTEQLVFD